MFTILLAPRTFPLVVRRGESQLAIRNCQILHPDQETVDFQITDKILTGSYLVLDHVRHHEPGVMETNSIDLTQLFKHSGSLKIT